MTLRYPYEVRKQSEYFDEIADEKIPKDMLELASHIVKSKAGHFHPEKFEDQYEDALKELLKKKQHGEKIEAPRERERAVSAEDHHHVDLLDEGASVGDAAAGHGGHQRGGRRLEHRLDAAGLKPRGDFREMRRRFAQVRLGDDPHARNGRESFRHFFSMCAGPQPSAPATPRADRSPRSLGAFR